MIRVAASLCSAASGATAATGAGMRQVTDSRKAAARYRAEYLRLSNAPTSAAATCDNTVRCACAAPRTLTTPPRCIPNDIGLETSREVSAHSIRASGPSYSVPLAHRIVLVTRCYFWLYPNHLGQCNNVAISKHTSYALCICEGFVKSFPAWNTLERNCHMMVNRRL